MKAFTFVFVIALSLASCSEEGESAPVCSTPATVRDLSNLDGCGWVFELSDGTRLIPQRMMFCGTPPLPKEVTEDPLYQFDYVDGKQVLINYEIIPDVATICMSGELAKITCISDRVVQGNE